MSAPVEARSISSLSALFANPPRYPRNPTHQTHEPLVLYIVRVPGSKDVFLTPLKPPTKASISIEAVQSSLYFLHVERPEDEELRKSLEATKAAECRNKENVPIQRKPLPPTPYVNHPASQRPPTPPKSYPHYQPALSGTQTSTQADRYAARRTHLRLKTSEATSHSGITRKPVSARLMRSPAQPSPGTTPEEGGNALTPAGDAQMKFKLARKPVQSTSPADAYEPNRASADNASLRASPVGQSRGSDPGFTSAEAGRSSRLLRITLIRRDPTSGSQWNVGSIIYPGPEPQGNPLREFEIELTSPGYVKFAQLEGDSGHLLKRRVAYMLIANNEGSPLTRQRSNSSDFFHHTHSSSNKKPRHAFSFVSPWQGVCAFSNGVDGKSIRCRHTLPPANPSVPTMAVDVAELRFNLPWSFMRLKDPHKQENNNSESIHPPRSSMASNREQWRRSLQTLTHKARMQLSHVESSDHTPRLTHSRKDSSQSDQSVEEDRLNLDLGRERAGGGFKGKSAKLGKLIIGDEGLKMCDLVVAASMGVWWQHYAGDLSHD
ncbi:hypothetical protein HRR83_004837 [Exophiala dermatitidis]|uniref:Uncharacterized protein n=2 Tax=Exophiala dermatitidis TaxID=5970 RepID=H6C3T8_EXODN|nr:uncharacterized protein HMPREF1120_06315 [Exophiala dermatitidis NIH/UT8656]KAJ4513995.1 hypothetical protein HRR75_004576 [Exophiala dermatitidis]EHY58303.1 hypothetical protein HMPREF1120_06315 [Exophiala dermatitidis NIH/UT8656]KAJ4517246.1 hypothetical protein HRR74_004996 [Exophiala dermatitidis]KAJ4519575.1 hypothetical protein HRR73_003635 [Exophiala dermatitidis]KAJ4534628.1 hypothetical protein HRR76_006546 [Exophiala dermatitidis]